MKSKKILYIALVIIFIVAIIMTATIGLKVDLNYAEGNTITFTVGKSIETKEIKEIASQIWNSKNILVQEVELFGDSAIIKVTENVTDEQVQDLCSKINEKYGVELTASNFSIEHISNVKLSTIVEPYIIPFGLSTLLIVGFYAIRYKGTKKMMELIRNLIISEGLLYSIYAIARIPVNELVMSIALFVYALTVFVSTIKSEMQLDTKSAKKEENKPE